MDEKGVSRKKVVDDALELIENLKTILALRGKWEFDIRTRLLEMEKELEVADCNDPETDKLLQQFSLLNQEILDGAVELTPKDKFN